MRECLRDAEDAAADIGIAVIDADGVVADEDLAGADLGSGLLQAKPVEAAVVPEDNSFHHLQ